MPALSPTVHVGQAVAAARAAAKPTRRELAQRNPQGQRAIIGITQAELAHRIGGESSASISRLESGFHEPRLGKLIQIAEALGVTLESLLPV